MHLKKSILLLGFLVSLTSIAFSSDWEIRRHTEVKPDSISRSYYIQKTIDNVKISNSTFSTGIAQIVFKFASPDFMLFSVYEDGLDNPAKKFYKTDYTYFTFSDDRGKSITFAIDSTRGNGNAINGMKAIALRDMMLNSPYIRGSINVENITYDFLMNTFEFRNVFTELCGYLEYNESEIERAVYPITAIFDSIFRLITSEMCPHYKDSQKPYYDVNVDKVRDAVEDVKLLFPNLYDSVMFEFFKISYSEWLSYYSYKYDCDITTKKNMQQVEELFKVLTVEITDIEDIGHSPKIEELKKNEKLNGDNMNAEYEKELPSSYDDSLDDGMAYLKAEDRRSNYAKIRSYGLGLNTSFNGDLNKKELKIDNKVSWGIVFETNGFFNKSHGMNFGIGFFNDGDNNGFEQYLGYSYRLPFNKKFEMVVSPSLSLSLKNVPCEAIIKVLYGDGITNNIVGFLGARIDVGFNWFFTNKSFLTFGVADKVTGPGFTLLERYKAVKPSLFSNTAEGYIGIGISF